MRGEILTAAGGRAARRAFPNKAHLRRISDTNVFGKNILQ